MRLKPIAILLLIFLLPIFTLLGASCKPEEGPMDIENSLDLVDEKVIEVTENFINYFWQADVNYFYHNNTKQSDGVHKSGPAKGVYTDFWLEAQHWETIMDIYERQGGEKYLQMIDAVYTGFKRFYPNYKTNEYNDDIGWWAKACTRAYKITGNSIYLDMAKEMFDHIYLSYSEDLGGGIFWNTHHNEKNVCTNAPAAVTSARLSLYLKDSTYLEKSVSIFNWVKDNLYNEETGKLNDTVRKDTTIYTGQFSYNYGTFAEAAYEIYIATGDSTYLTYTEKPLNYFLAYKTENGIVRDEGEGDGAAFRTVLFRTLKALTKAKICSYQQIINQNALATYENRRESDLLCGYNWAEKPSEDMIVSSIAVGASVSLFQFYTP